MPHRLARLALAAALLAAPVFANAAETSVALSADSEQVVNGVAVGCTGIGQSKNEPRWLEYPLRVEFADPRREFLADGVLTVSDAQGRRLLTVTCDGPWFLFKLPPAAYRLEGVVPGRGVGAQSATVRAPAKGQTRFVLEFPDP